MDERERVEEMPVDLRRQRKAPVGRGGGGVRRRWFVASGPRAGGTAADDRGVDLEPLVLVGLRSEG